MKKYTALVCLNFFLGQPGWLGGLFSCFGGGRLGVFTENRNLRQNRLRQKVLTGQFLIFFPKFQKEWVGHTNGHITVGTDF